MPFYDGQIVTNLYWIGVQLKSLKIAAWSVIIFLLVHYLLGLGVIIYLLWKMEIL